MSPLSFVWWGGSPALPAVQQDPGSALFPSDEAASFLLSQQPVSLHVREHDAARGE